MSTAQITSRTAGAAEKRPCAHEPIHTPGSIQPCGVLLVLDEPGLTVLQVSRNAGEHLRTQAHELLGKSLVDLLGLEQTASLRRLVQETSIQQTPVCLRGVTLAGAAEPYNAMVHRHDGVLILELEATAGTAPQPDDPSLPMRRLLARLHAAPTVRDLAQVAAEEVRLLTGFDRVLIYRFDSEWNGTVIAEDVGGRLPSYLGLRFPAADVPEQARELYRQSRIRIIPDSEYVPAPIEPALNPRTGRPLDLSYSVLRSVSPVHAQYMRNMGTPASMSVSLVHDGRLWGLISCHHASVHRVPYETRALCDLFGQVLTLQIGAKESAAEAEHRVELKSIQTRLLAHMAGQEDFARGLADGAEDVLRFAQATGAAVVRGGDVELIGRTPRREQVLTLCDWLAASVDRDVFHTESLPEVFPPAAAYADLASGVLAVSISKLHRSFLLWFRAELMQTVRWGGNPRPSVKDGGLHPRASFELWKETVRGRSAPWRRSEAEAAADLRNSIVGIVLRRAEELAELNDELRRANKELESFSYSVSHDLRAPFRHIVGYAELLREQYAAGLDATGRRYVATIIESAMDAGRLVDNLLSFSQMGRAALHPMRVDMGALVGEIRRELTREAKGRQIRWEMGDLPAAWADLMMLRLAVRNLLENAVKYTRQREEAVIEVGGERLERETVYWVRDNGVGFDMAYADKLFGVFQRLHRIEEFEGTGIGLANVRRIVGRHGGRTWAEGEVGRGAAFYFSLPNADGLEV